MIRYVPTFSLYIYCDLKIYDIYIVFIVTEFLLDKLVVVRVGVKVIQSMKTKARKFPRKTFLFI